MYCFRFKDTYNAGAHNTPSVLEVRKFTYFKSLVKGEAEGKR